MAIRLNFIYLLRIQNIFILYCPDIRPHQNNKRLKGYRQLSHILVLINYNITTYNIIYRRLTCWRCIRGTRTQNVNFWKTFFIRISPYEFNLIYFCEQKNTYTIKMNNFWPLSCVLLYFIVDIDYLCLSLTKRYLYFLKF